MKVVHAKQLSEQEKSGLIEALVNQRGGSIIAVPECRLDDLARFKNNKSGNIYTLFAVVNQNSKRDDFPEMAVYWDENNQWWARPLGIFLSKNTNIDSTEPALLTQWSK